MLLWLVALMLYWTSKSTAPRLQKSKTSRQCSAENELIRRAPGFADILRYVCNDFTTGVHFHVILRSCLMRHANGCTRGSNGKHATSWLCTQTPYLKRKTAAVPRILHKLLTYRIDRRLKMVDPVLFPLFVTFVIATDLFAARQIVIQSEGRPLRKRRIPRAPFFG